MKYFHRSLIRLLIIGLIILFTSSISLSQPNVISVNLNNAYQVTTLTDQNTSKKILTEITTSDQLPLSSIDSDVNDSVNTNLGNQDTSVMDSNDPGDQVENNSTITLNAATLSSGDNDTSSSNITNQESQSDNSNKQSADTTEAATVLSNYGRLKIGTTRGNPDNSAVAMYWNLNELKPGQTRQFATYYGIGGFTIQDLLPPLAINIEAPQELIKNETNNGYSANPFTITAHVWNNGTGTVKNIKLHLELPKELSLVSGNNDVSLGDLQQSSEKNISWQVKAENQTTENTLNYSIKASADDIEDKLVTLSVKLPAVKINSPSHHNRNLVSSVTVNKPALTLTIGGRKETLSATVSPSNAAYKAVNWSSDKEAVATVNVSTGEVTPRGVGTCHITAMTIDGSGKYAQCTVTVEPVLTIPISIKITGEKSGLVGSNIKALAASNSIAALMNDRGLQTGQKIHEPFIITKEVDETSPIIMKMLCTNEKIKQVELRFTQSNPIGDGTILNPFTIKLLGVNIASVNLNEDLNSNGFVSEEISFTFQKIEWTWNDGDITESDS